MTLAVSYRGLSAAAEDLQLSWPPAVPKPPFWYGAFSLGSVRGRVTSALRRASNGSVERLGEFLRLESDESLAESVRRQCAASLEELKNVEIVLPPEPDDADLSEPAKAEQPRGVAALATSGVA